jgi:murein DD-endopeptidase MepM/ murein hydrolase activator NlpD
VRPPTGSKPRPGAAPKPTRKPAPKPAAKPVAKPKPKPVAKPAKAAGKAAAKPKARRASISAPAFAPVNAGIACPIAGPYHVSDSWGARRGGGRAHEGTDVMGRYGAPVYAYAGGTVTRTTYNRGLGGTTVWVRGDGGTTYYYAHLSSIAVRPGQRVRPGQPIGANGSSGNASEGAPHLHFEVHPGGHGPVNPYPYIRRACT